MLITGASRGIGAATALEAAKNGYHVILNYHKTEEKARALSETIRAFGGECTLFCADVSDSSERPKYFRSHDVGGKFYCGGSIPFLILRIVVWYMTSHTRQ